MFKVAALEPQPLVLLGLSLTAVTVDSMIQCILGILGINGHKQFRSFQSVLFGIRRMKQELGFALDASMNFIQDIGSFMPLQHCILVSGKISSRAKPMPPSPMAAGREGNQHFFPALAVSPASSSLFPYLSEPMMTKIRLFPHQVLKQMPSAPI